MNIFCCWKHSSTQNLFAFSIWRLSVFIHDIKIDLYIYQKIPTTNARFSIIYDACDGWLQATFSFYLSNFICPYIIRPFMQSLAEKGPQCNSIHPRRSQSHDQHSQSWNELYQSGSELSQEWRFCFFFFIAVAHADGALGGDKRGFDPLCMQRNRTCSWGIGML